MTYWNLAKHFGALSVLWISYGDDNAPGFVRTASKSRVEREGNIFKVRFSAKRLHCVIEDGAIITQLWQGKRQWDFIAVCSCKEGINISTPLLRRVWLHRIRKNLIRIAKMSREWKPAKDMGNHTSGTNSWKVMIIFSSKELFLTITALKCHAILMQAIFAKWLT